MSKLRTVIVVLVVATVVATVLYTVSETGGEENYLLLVEREREKRMDFLRSSDESPFNAEGAQPFRAPQYYTADRQYEVRATLTKNSMKEPFTLGNTGGQQERYFIYGYADFTIEGQPCRLMLLEPLNNADPDYLFVPFADATSGLATYGSGRYLDLDKPASGSTIMIDFNLAYNPYCAYNESFICPLPPSRNVLPVAIPAGEKNFGR